MRADRLTLGFGCGGAASAGLRACLSLFLAAALMTGAAAAPPSGAPATARTLPPTGLSLAHFDHLYTDLEIDGKQMAVVHIYAKFPDYRYAIEPNEGYACVDDAARALVLLAREWRHKPDPELLRKLRRLTEFVLHLQHRDGYFHNFIRNDQSINTVYRTSVAELNWWSLRALLGLEEAYPLLQADAALAARIDAATQRIAHNLERDLALPHTTQVVNGVTVPAWLPAGSGADQGAEAIVALLAHYRRSGDPALPRLVASLADGLLVMQKGDAGTYPYGMFLSWRSTWHAWGNGQAYALLLAGEALGRQDYVAAALKEVDAFYPYLLKNGFAESIDIRGTDAALVETARRRYPQIAYGIRPMVQAAAKAYVLTGEERYRALAADLGAWLSGRNDAGTPMYDPATGIVFDGIPAAGQVSRDSGAESTIEALLTLQALREIGR